MSVNTASSLERRNSSGEPPDPPISLAPPFNRVGQEQLLTLEPVTDATGSRAAAATPGGLRGRDPGDPAPARSRCIGLEYCQLTPARLARQGHLARKIRDITAESLPARRAKTEVRQVMPAMPRIQPDGQLERHFSALGMHEDPLELSRRHRPHQCDPP